MTRYYLGKLLGWNFYLHRFTQGDGDRRLHNHPWQRSLAIVLQGSYTEAYAEGICCERGPIVRHRRVRWFNWIGPNKLHTITDLHSPVVWTLFIREKRTRDWGFLTPIYTGSTPDRYWAMVAYEHQSTEDI